MENGLIVGLSWGIYTVDLAHFVVSKYKHKNKNDKVY